MTEYIGRDVVIRCIEDQCVERKMWGCDDSDVTLIDAYDAVEAVIDLPAADVAPVVHCRHCRSYNRPRLGWCSVHLDRENPDDFCSYGVRRDGDSDAAD